MDIEQLKAYLDEMFKYLNADNLVSAREAEIRAGRFLEAQYRIAAGIRSLERERFKLESYKNVTFNQLLSATSGKTVKEKQSAVDADPTFIPIQEKYSDIESDLSFLKNVARVFADGHVFYRQQAKGDNGNGNF
jgi:hypothetical protein